MFKIILQKIATFVGLLAFSKFLQTVFMPRTEIPEHMIGFPVVYELDFITPEVGKEMNDLIKKFGADPGITSRAKGHYTVDHDHIGEGLPKIPGEVCAHPFLVPDKTETLCILPQRIDIGRHYTLTGSSEGLREPHANMFNRMSSFGRYMTDLYEHEAGIKLFESEKFQKAAKTVCPADKQLLDPFQFNLVIQIPGQTVPVHVDGVYFYGASSAQFPNWFLAAMSFSNLFKENLID